MRNSLTKQLRLDIEGYLEGAEHVSSNRDAQDMRYRAFVLMGLREDVSSYQKERAIEAERLQKMREAKEAQGAGKRKTFMGRDKDGRNVYEYA